jgi:hypothetical protein
MKKGESQMERYKKYIARGNLRRPIAPSQSNLRKSPSVAPSNMAHLTGNASNRIAPSE